MRMRWTDVVWSAYCLQMIGLSLLLRAGVFNAAYALHDADANDHASMTKFPLRPWLRQTWARWGADGRVCLTRPTCVCTSHVLNCIYTCSHTRSPVACSNTSRCRRFAPTSATRWPCTLRGSDSTRPCWCRWHWSVS